MKSHKKLIIAISLLIALGAVGTAIAVTYYEHTAIAPVSITSHSDDDTVFAGGEFTFACTTSTDTDKYYNSGNCRWYYPSDNVVHTWTGDGQGFGVCRGDTGATTGAECK